MTRLIIQIPCFNEEESIARTLADLPRKIEGVDELFVLLIDDGSADNTARVGLENGADYVVQHPSNRGLAKAYITGIQTSLALGGDIIVNTDADNQYPGRYIPDLIAPVLKRRTIDSTGSTSSNGRGVSANLKSSNPRSVPRWLD